MNPMRSVRANVISSRPYKTVTVYGNPEGPCNQSRAAQIEEMEQLRTYCNLRNAFISPAPVEAAEMRFGLAIFRTAHLVPHVPSIAALDFSSSPRTLCPNLFLNHLFYLSILFAHLTFFSSVDYLVPLLYIYTPWLELDHGAGLPVRVSS